MKHIVYIVIGVVLVAAYLEYASLVMERHHLESNQ